MEQYEKVTVYVEDVRYGVYIGLRDIVTGEVEYEPAVVEEIVDDADNYGLEAGPHVVKHAVYVPNAQNRYPIDIRELWPDALIIADSDTIVMDRPVRVSPKIEWRPADGLGYYHGLADETLRFQRFDLVTTQRIVRDFTEYWGDDCFAHMYAMRWLDGVPIVQVVEHPNTPEVRYVDTRADVDGYYAIDLKRWWFERDNVIVKLL